MGRMESKQAPRRFCSRRTHGSWCRRSHDGSYCCDDGRLFCSWYALSLALVSHSFGTSWLSFLNLTLVHCSKQLFFDVDVMEVQTAMITSLLLTGYFGVRWWREDALVPIPTIYPFSALTESKIDLGGALGSYPGAWNDDVIDFTSGYAQLSIAFLGCGFFGVTQNVAKYLYAVISAYAAPAGAQPVPIQRGSPGCTPASLVHQVGCLSIHVGATWMAFCAMRADPDTPDDAYIALIICACFAFGDLMDRILIMRVAQVPLALVPPAVILAPLFLAAQRLSASGQLPAQLPLPWWWIVAAASVLAHLAYFVTIVRRLARVLGIHPAVTR